jgi:hypothetical protein
LALTSASLRKSQTHAGSAALGGTQQDWHVAATNRDSQRWYRLGLTLFDIEQPEKYLVRNDSWMFAPQAEYERRGDVQDVVAGGPKGRDASADTDAWMRAEILSYSRSRGLFAGISLEGTTLRPDDDASADVYGHSIKAKDIVRGNGTRVTNSGHALVNALQKSAPNNESEQAAKR